MFMFTFSENLFRSVIIAGEMGEREVAAIRYNCDNNARYVVDE